MEEIDDSMDITEFNAKSGTFDFLADEPDLYSRADLKKVYDPELKCQTSDV